jgi:hypothetical protein
MADSRIYQDLIDSIKSALYTMNTKYNIKVEDVKVEWVERAGGEPRIAAIHFNGQHRRRCDDRHEAEHHQGGDAEETGKLA